MLKKISSVEKIIMTMPKMMATRVSKDLLRQQQQTSQLKAELKTLTTKKKEVGLKVTGLKKKKTATAVKQIKSAQKTSKSLDKTLIKNATQLNVLEKQVQALREKKAKYLALQAQLVLFEKEWAKKGSKKTKTKTKTVAKTKTKKKVKAKSGAISKAPTLPLDKNPTSMIFQTQTPLTKPVEEISEHDKVELA